MKSLVLCAAAMLITAASFAQKAKAQTNTPVKPYLTYTCTMHPQYVSNMPVKCPVCNMAMNISGKEKMKAEVVKLYTCPRHHDVYCTKAGKCAKCNMNMTEFKPEANKAGTE